MRLAGARAEVQELLRKREYRSPWQALSIANGAFWPVLLFAYVYYIGLGSLRFYHWARAACLGVCPGLGACLFASLEVRRRRRLDIPARGLASLTICLWVALLAGLLVGDRSYWGYMMSYYNYQDMASYTDIDPSVDKGQSYMDAGQVYFKEGTEVATHEMVAFQSGHVYCVAPIVGQPIWNQGGAEQVAASGPLSLPRSGTIDFWAVGTDCCDQSSGTFACGAVGDPRARAGLRMLWDDARSYYLMAVQEWTARLCPPDDNTVAARSQAAPQVCLPARHPLFFHWVRDPIEEVDSYQAKAMKLYSMHVFLFFMANLFLTLALLWALFHAGVR